MFNPLTPPLPCLRDLVSHFMFRELTLSMHVHVNVAQKRQASLDKIDEEEKDILARQAVS